MTDKPVKYTAQLKGVRELALAGAADLSWWTDHLAGEGPLLLAGDGRVLAQLRPIAGERIDAFDRPIGAGGHVVGPRSHDSAGPVCARRGSTS